MRLFVRMSFYVYVHMFVKHPEQFLLIRCYVSMSLLLLLLVETSIVCVFACMDVCMCTHVRVCMHECVYCHQVIFNCLFMANTSRWNQYM